MERRYIGSLDSKKNNKVFSLFVKEINKTYKSLRDKDLDTIYNITWKGHNVNCLPFIINGIPYFENRGKEKLFELARSLGIDKIVTKDDFKNIKNFDKSVYNSVVPSPADVGLTGIALLIHRDKPLELVRLLYDGYIDVLQEYIFEGIAKDVKFQCKDICNTQALCYYLGLYWVLNISPMFKTYIGKEVKQRGFYDYIKVLCPDGCIHDKYLSGIIDSDELLNLYRDRMLRDGSSIRVRDFLSVYLEGDYNGDDLTSREVEIIDYVSELSRARYYIDISSALGYSFMFDGGIEAANDMIEDLKNDLEKAHETISNSISKNEDLRLQVQDLKSTIESKDNEILDLKKEISSRPLYDELNNELESLKNEIKLLKAENEELFNERLDLKQLISSQKKQLRSADKSSNDVEEVIEEIEEIIDDFNLDAALDLLRDKRYAFVGGYFIKSIGIKLDNYGFKNIKTINSNTRDLGKCDYLVLVTSQCKHEDVFKAEHLIRGTDTELVYFNGSNVEQLIKQIYDLEVKSC